MRDRVYFHKKRMKKFIFFSLLLTGFLISANLHAQASDKVLGKWKTIDDNTGKAKSIVELYKKDDLLYGKITKLYREPGEEQNPLCDDCPGEKKNKPVLGMVIITDMHYDADDHEWDDGEILDPESGNVYDCKLWVNDEGKLKVRGYLAFFYRTQTWLPMD